MGMHSNSPVAPVKRFYEHYRCLITKSCYSQTSKIKTIQARVNTENKTEFGRVLPRSHTAFFKTC